MGDRMGGGIVWGMTPCAKGGMTRNRFGVSLLIVEALSSEFTIKYTALTL